MTRPQFRCVFALARAAGLDYELLHAMLRDRFHRDSLKQLRPDESRRLIDHLKRLSGQPPSLGYRDSRLSAGESAISEHCSQAQLAQIKYLTAVIPDFNEIRLWGIIRARWGLRPLLNTLSDLTPDQATKLILTLKAERIRADAKTDPSDSSDLSDCEIDALPQ